MHQYPCLKNRESRERKFLEDPPIVRALRDYRREGRTKARFNGEVGPSKETKGEKYPHQQDLKITILDDRPRKTETSGG